MLGFMTAATAAATVAMVFVVATSPTPFGWALLAAAFIMFLTNLTAVHADWIEDDVRN